MSAAPRRDPDDASAPPPMRCFTVELWADDYLDFRTATFRAPDAQTARRLGLAAFPGSWHAVARPVPVLRGFR